MRQAFALQTYILRFFFPVFIVALLFFILLLQLGELFINLSNYLAFNVPITSILKILYLYIPKCIAFSFPLAMLFAVAYTLGSLYGTNELIAMFSAGISLKSLTSPLLFFALLASIAMFFFEDKIVIYSFAQKEALSNSLLFKTTDLSSSNVIVQSKHGTVIYQADRYLDDEKTLINPLIILRSKEGDLEYVISANSAEWHAPQWLLNKPFVYDCTNSPNITYSYDASQFLFDEKPSIFQKKIQKVDEMTLEETRYFIDELRKAGLPYNEYLAQYYRRFTFPLTIFIVVLLSIPAGGWFKKNTLLMTLLFSLLIATIYYVAEMITMLFAKWAYISPLFGAVSPFLFFCCIGIFLLSRSKT